MHCVSLDFTSIARIRELVNKFFNDFDFASQSLKPMPCYRLLQVFCPCFGRL
jgi:hypothetical protein